MFDVVKVKNDCVEWIRGFFEENGKDCNAIIGISGGKDSSIVAALCVEALGKDRVIGVLMPNGEQHDIDMAQLLVKQNTQADSLIKNEYAVSITDVLDSNGQSIFSTPEDDGNGNITYSICVVVKKFY